MKLLFILLSFCLRVNGVFDAGLEEVSVSVKEGDSVTLNTDVKITKQDNIYWYFIDTLIAQIIGDLSFNCTDVQCDDETERYRDRLKLDHQTGSLTIMNINIPDSGLYQLQIIKGENVREKIFNVTVYGVSADERDEMKRKSVKEGESVTLDPAVTKNPNDVMKWYFNEILITEITGDQSKICTDDQCDERFRDRLKLDHQTGSLTIMNTTNTDEGEYHLQINSSTINIHLRQISVSRIKRFSVTVTAVPDSGLSSAAVAGIVVGVVAVLLAAVAAVIYSNRHRIYTPAAQNENNGL